MAGNFNQLGCECCFNCPCPEGLPSTVAFDGWEQDVYYSTSSGGTYLLFDHQTADDATLDFNSEDCTYSGSVTFHNEIYNTDGSVCTTNDETFTVTLSLVRDEEGECYWRYNNVPWVTAPLSSTPVGSWSWDHFGTLSAPAVCDWIGGGYNFSHSVGSVTVS